MYVPKKELIFKFIFEKKEKKMLDIALLLIQIFCNYIIFFP
jgi:hypothetical protein